MGMSIFGIENAPDFVMFTLTHYAAIAGLLLIILGLYFFRRQIKASPLGRSFTRYGLIVLLLISDLSLYAWYFVEDVWDVRHTLPLELCTITLTLSIFMLITRSRWMYQILFFAGIGGALQAFLTPNLAYGFPHFRFFQFFVAHAAIILAALYMTWIEEYRPTWKSILWTMLFLNGLAVTVGIINYLIGANYMYLNRKPDSPSVLDLLGPYPIYLIAEEAFALILCILLYSLFFVLPDKMKSRTRERGK